MLRLFGVSSPALRAVVGALLLLIGVLRHGTLLIVAGAVVLVSVGVTAFMSTRSRAGRR